MGTAERSPKKRTRTKTPPAGDLTIEDAWRYVDRFCRALWLKHMDDEPPASLAIAITTLRDEELLPFHEANMMHTIRSLRNMVVHENVEFGDPEITIARAAWEIIRAWAQKQERATWQRITKLCA